MASFYDDVIFPESISLYALKGKRQRLTTVVELQSGFDQRRSLWVRTRRTYDAGLVTRPASQWLAIEDLFDLVDGQAIGFLLKDPIDGRVAVADGMLFPVLGEVFSLQKARRVGARTTYRAIGKPRASTFTLYVDRGGVVSPVAPGAYVLDATKGSVTFAQGYRQAGDVFTWAGDFYVPVRFQTDDLDWETVDKQPNGELLISAPSIPIVEDRQDGLLFVPPT